MNPRHQEPAMIFHDPDTLRLWISIFLTVAAASAAFAVVALTVGIRDLRRPHVAPAGPGTGRRLPEVQPELERQAA
jgi:hypothetical protein